MVRSRALQAAAWYFTLVFTAGFALALVRIPFLVPRIGERWAELVEMPVMLAVIVLAARFIVRRFDLQTRAGYLTAGAGALVLLLAAEALVAMAMQGLELVDYLASRDPVSGTVYVVMLMAFAAMPAIVAAARAGDRHRGTR